MPPKVAGLTRFGPGELHALGEDGERNVGAVKPNMSQWEGYSSARYNDGTGRRTDNQKTPYARRRLPSAL
jgi:hypothetical protein